MRNLIIVGARGWGREVYAGIKASSEVISGKISIKGFLDSDSNALEGLNGNYPPILGTPETYEIQLGDIFFIAMGEPKWREYYADMISSRGGEFYTYISPLAIVNDTAEIGEGSYIAGWSSVSDNVKLGKHVIVHSFCALGHDAIVEDYASMLSYVFLGGYSAVGRCSTMNPKSMIIPHKKIGNNVTVGAGSVVIRNIKDGLSVLGNPAKKIDY